MSFPIIDSHQHIWDKSKATYDWLTEEFTVLNRVFEFEELRPQIANLGIDFTIQVQSADNLADTELMRESARHHPEVAAIVGYAPLEDPQKAFEVLNSWQSDDLMVGVRNLIHNQTDPKWLLRPDVNAGLGVLAASGYSFDVVSVTSEQLQCVPIISERHQNLRMVIDHLSKPPIGLGDDREWKDLITQAASNPLVYGKISGLYSATADPSAWSTELVRPYFEFALEVFGAERLMYGGDWPVALLAGGYTRVWNGLNPLFNSVSAEEREALLGRTAFEFYQISGSRLGLDT